MEWIGGTDRIHRLMVSLERDGSLLNFYSQDVLDRTQIKENFDISQVDFDSKQYEECSNHLLVGCFHSSKLHLLINSFEPCKRYFKACYQYKHYDTRPCFGIINLKTKSVCIMSIGNRKGHFYEQYFTASMKNLDTVQKEFEDYDHAGIVARLRELMTNIADVMNKFSCYEDEITDQDIEERDYDEQYLQKIFPKFDLICIQETFKPF